MTTPTAEQERQAARSPRPSRRRSEYDESERLGRRPRRRFRAQEVVTTVYLALFVGGCLNSGTLVNMAEVNANDPASGFVDDRLYDLARANDRLSSMFGLDRFARLFGDGDSPVMLATEPETTPSTVPRTTMPPEPPRTVDAAAPLRLYVGGDSLGKDLAGALARVTPVDLVTPEADARVATGLTRPDAFDWPRRIAEIMGRDQLPDAVVFMSGSNDWQDKFQLDDRGSPEWQQFYTEQVTTVMDLLDQPGVHVFWVGLPPMRPDKISDDGVRLMNTIFEDAAAARPWVTYVDAYEMFAGPQGGYSETLDGSVVRQDDGVHLNVRGVDLLGEAVWGKIQEHWEFLP